MEENNAVFECITCGFAVATEEVARYDTEPEIRQSQVVVDPSEVDTLHDEFVVRRCPRCKKPFLHKYTFYNHHEAGTYLQEVEQLYPTEVDTLISLGTIPTVVRKAFQQAKKCHSGGLYEPSVIMSRKCLEAICGNLGASGHNLADKVDWLLKSQKIDSKLHQWATQLRLIGNDAAHDLGISISRKNSEDSLAFLNAMLLYIYTLEKKFAKFVQRRKKA